MQHVRYNEYEINIRKQGKGARDYLDEKVVMLCYTKHVNRNLKELRQPASHMFGKESSWQRNYQVQRFKGWDIPV